MKIFLILSIMIMLCGCAPESRYHIVRLCNGFNKLYQDANGKYWIGTAFGNSEPILQEDLSNICPVGEQK